MKFVLAFIGFVFACLEGALFPFGAAQAATVLTDSIQVPVIKGGAAVSQETVPAGTAVEILRITEDGAYPAASVKTSSGVVVQISQAALFEKDGAGAAPGKPLDWSIPNVALSSLVKTTGTGKSDFTGSIKAEKYTDWNGVRSGEAGALFLVNLNRKSGFLDVFRANIALRVEHGSGVLSWKTGPGEAEDDATWLVFLLGKMPQGAKEFTVSYEIRLLDWTKGKGGDAEPVGGPLNAGLASDANLRLARVPELQNAWFKQTETIGIESLGGAEASRLTFVVDTKRRTGVIELRNINISFR